MEHRRRLKCYRRDNMGNCIQDTNVFTPHKHSIHQHHKAKPSTKPKPKKTRLVYDDRKTKEKSYEEEEDGTAAELDKDFEVVARERFRARAVKEEPTLENFSEEMMDLKHLIEAADIIQGDGGKIERTKQERTVLAQEHLNQHTNGRLKISPQNSNHDLGILFAVDQNGKTIVAQPGSRLKATKGTVQDWAHNAVAYDLPHHGGKLVKSLLMKSNLHQSPIGQKLLAKVHEGIDTAVEKSHEHYQARRDAKRDFAVQRGFFDPDSPNFVETYTGSSKGANDSVNLAHDGHIATSNTESKTEITNLSRKSKVKAFNMMTTQDVFNEGGTLHTLMHPEKGNVEVHVIRNQGDIATSFFGLRKLKNAHDRIKSRVKSMKANPREAIEGVLRNPYSILNEAFAESAGQNFKMDTIRTENKGAIERHLNLLDRFGVREQAKAHFYHGRVLRETEIHADMIKSVKRGDTFSSFINKHVRETEAKRGEQLQGELGEGGRQLLERKPRRRVTAKRDIKVQADPGLREEKVRGSLPNLFEGLDRPIQEKGRGTSEVLSRLEELHPKGRPRARFPVAMPPDKIGFLSQLWEETRGDLGGRPISGAEWRSIHAAEPKLRQGHNFLQPNVNEELKSLTSLMQGNDHVSTMYSMKDREGRSRLTKMSNQEHQAHINELSESYDTSTVGLDSALSAQRAPKKFSRKVYEHISNAFQPTELASGFIAGAGGEMFSNELLGKADADLGQGDANWKDVGEISGRAALSGAASVPVGKTIMTGLGAVGLKDVAETAVQRGASAGVKAFAAGLGAEMVGTGVGMAIGAAATYGIEKLAKDTFHADEETAMGVGETLGGAIGGAATVGLTEGSTAGIPGVIAGAAVGAAFGLGGYMMHSGARKANKKRKKEWERQNEKKYRHALAFQNSGGIFGQQYQIRPHSFGSSLSAGDAAFRQLSARWGGLEKNRQGWHATGYQRVVNTGRDADGKEYFQNESHQVTFTDPGSGKTSTETYGTFSTDDGVAQAPETSLFDEIGHGLEDAWNAINPF